MLMIRNNGIYCKQSLCS